MVASTCANMGLDAKDVNFVVSVAPFSSDWELKQGEGRAGRGGQQAVSITLSREVRLPKTVASYVVDGTVFHTIARRLTRNKCAGNTSSAVPVLGRMKGMSAELRTALAGSGCSREKMNALFYVKNPYCEY